MLFIFAAASLTGYFFYTPLFIWGGGITFLLWVFKYIKRQSGSMAIGAGLMFLIIGGVLYFFFEWNGLAWAGVVLGILNSKVGYSWENQKSHGHNPKGFR
jgi:hypothetical protein